MKHFLHFLHSYIKCCKLSKKSIAEPLLVSNKICNYILNPKAEVKEWLWFKHCMLKPVSVIIEVTDEASARRVIWCKLYVLIFHDLIEENFIFQGLFSIMFHRPHRHPDLETIIRLKTMNKIRKLWSLFLYNSSVLIKTEIQKNLNNLMIF